MTYRKLLLVKVIVALLLFICGAAIYLLFRPRELLGFYVVDVLGFGDAVDSLRASVSDYHLSSFVLYCLPDGLWTTSYILVIDTLFHRYDIKSRMLWTSVIPVIGFLSEFGQLIGVLPGVFDIGDLLCYSLPYIILWCGNYILLK